MRYFTGAKMESSRVAMNLDLSGEIGLQRGDQCLAAYVLLYRGVSKVPASTAGVFTGVRPVSAVVLSILLLQEPVLWSYEVGILVVLSAIVLTGRNTGGTDRKEDSAT